MKTRLIALCFAAFAASAVADDAPAWVAPMREVHAKFTGKPGTFAQFGDSITVTYAYWAPLQHDRKNLDGVGKRAWERVNAHTLKDCWQWKGALFGSDGGKTVRWAEQKVEAWLKKLNPEAALIMFGTNDLNQVKADAYEAGLRAVVKRCLDNGTVVILSTIPPRHGQVEKSKQFADIARKIAADLKVPLVDYHAEILKRRPTDWNGAEQFKGQKDVYDVPTPISADGVHPSAPKKFANDYSEEALKSSGYNLRTYLTLIAYADVITNVLRP
jgi:lysophospholipase L1-like esterase